MYGTERLPPGSGDGAVCQKDGPSPRLTRAGSRLQRKVKSKNLRERYGPPRQESTARYTRLMPLPRKEKRDAFVRMVKDRYRAHGRHDLPWRLTRDPYRILVSEVMLQQTQVARVLGHYPRFLAAFPDPVALSGAKTSAVIGAWQGLGYNRRALALQRAMRAVAEGHRGRIPRSRDALLALPGIGPYTADAVRAFAWNEPGVLLETNVRAAYLHHFFAGREAVPDRELLPVVGATLDRERPREWYWALMDYGSFLKATAGNASRRSAGYARQKPFAGSDRQLRGRVLRLLAAGPRAAESLAEAAGERGARLERILAALIAEGFLAYDGKRYALAD